MRTILISLTLVLPAAASDLYVDDDAPGGGSGTSWADAFSTLQDALAVAQDGDRLVLAGGTYRPDQGAGYTLGDTLHTFHLSDDVVLEGGYRGLLGGGDPDDRDPLAFPTLLSGDLDGDGPYDNENSLHVVRVSNGKKVRLDGLTVRDGKANGTSEPGKRGGGLTATSATIRLVDCAIEENHGRWGGGLCAISCTLTIERCRFLANRGGANGCGMRVEGGSATLTEVELADNQAVNGSASGAGIHASAGAQITATDCSITGATAKRAGALYLFESSATLVRCDISGMVASGWGGGVYMDESALSVTDCTFTNLTGEYGGAIVATDSNTLEVVGCTFSECRATQSSAGAVASSTLTELVVRDSSFWNNHAMSGGGGGLSFGGGLVERCHFEGNTASGDGAGVRLIHLEPGTAILDCTFIGNSCNARGGGLSVEVTVGEEFELLRCSFEGNKAHYGGAFSALSHNEFGGVFRLRECVATWNLADVEGGGAYFDQVELDLDGFVVGYNSCPAQGLSAGGGIRIGDCAGTIRRATVYHNQVDHENGAGIAVAAGTATVRLVDSIVWDNHALFFPGAEEQIADASGTLSVEYTCVEAGYSGLGNILVDPLLVDPTFGDYHLQSSSPCIDAGDPASPVDPDCTRADMGAFHFPQVGLGRKLCAPAPVNSTGLPGRALAEGSLVVADDDLTVACDQLPPGAPAVLLSSRALGGGVPLGGGAPVLCVGAPYGADHAGATAADGAGVASFALDLANLPVGFGAYEAVLPGQTWTFQVLYLDTPTGLATNALALTFQ